MSYRFVDSFGKLVHIIDFIIKKTECVFTMKVKKCESVPQMVLAEIHDLCTCRECTIQ